MEEADAVTDDMRHVAIDNGATDVCALHFHASTRSLLSVGSGASRDTFRDERSRSSG
jgi:hypothetical protein